MTLQFVFSLLQAASQASHKCGFLLQMSHVLWSVCVSVCLCLSVRRKYVCIDRTKMAEPILSWFGRDSCESKEP